MDATTTTEIAKFEVGETYSCRSACNYDTVWQFTVVKRTAKFITITERLGDTYRVGVKVTSDATEMALPFGNYSMAPVIYARCPW